MLVGEPVPTEDCIALYRASPEVAVRRLTGRLAEALRRLIIEVNDRESLRLLHVIESIWREESQEATGDPMAQTELIRRVMRAYQYLMPREPGRIRSLRARVERYAKSLDLTGMTGQQPAQSYPAGVLGRYAIREGLPLVLGLSLALWGIANHVIPYQLTAAVVRQLRPSPASEASYKIAAAVLQFPVCWVGQVWLAWHIGGGWLLRIFIPSLVPTGFFALTWRERLDRVCREARGFFSSS